MCKFNKPQIPAGATADERRAIYFDALYSLDMNDKVEKRENLSYLSWANAWAEFKRAYPSATYRIVKDPITNLPYFADERTGIMVYTEVTVDEITHEMWLPVMNTSNKAMKLEPYTYKVYDKFKKEYVERTVEAASMFDINKTIMRCLVKNLAMFGLGLYIYAGEDIPEKMVKDNTIQQEPAPVQPKRTRKSRPIQQPVQEKYAGIRIALQQCKTQDSLMELYKQHQNEVTGNTEIKALFTERKLQLNQAV
ncbi:DUF1071 domain-containing protein [Phocaeicola coprophilus]|uniref:Sak single strand annealing protein n=1 Tax=Phocaeicola coprophilus TaxID=387090 RepID=UPI0026DC6631|nr:DUF1071 domain-containing protein [Phocaeicola coprophilus]